MCCMFPDLPLWVLFCYRPRPRRPWITSTSHKEHRRGAQQGGPLGRRKVIWMVIKTWETQVLLASGSFKESLTWSRMWPRRKWNWDEQLNRSFSNWIRKNWLELPTGFPTGFPCFADAFQLFSVEAFRVAVFLTGPGRNIERCDGDPAESQKHWHWRSRGLVGKGRLWCVGRGIWHMDGGRDFGVTRGVGRVLGLWILQKVFGTEPDWAICQLDRYTWNYWAESSFVFAINCLNWTWPSLGLPLSFWLIWHISSWVSVSGSPFANEVQFECLFTFSSDAFWRDNEKNGATS